MQRLDAGGLDGAGILVETSKPGNEWHNMCITYLLPSTGLAFTPSVWASEQGIQAMQDLKDTDRWPKESTCIELDRLEELNFWSWRLRVSVGMLRRAVRLVGCKFKDVSLYLAKKRMA